MHRYAAKLLFQFRVDVDGAPGKRRICEERIVNFRSKSHDEALRSAKRRGRKSESSYDNSDGNRVTFEFIGVMDLMTLGVEAAEDEVWYDIRERLMPMERREKIIPSEAELIARLTGETR